MTELTKGQKTALKILEAASRCISKKGIEKASITNIALEAEVKRPLIAYHFPKKDEIFFRVMIHISEQLTLALDSQKNHKKGIPELVDFSRQYFNFFFSSPHYFHCFLLFFYQSSINKDYRSLQTKLNAKAQLSLIHI